jgi:hypothetical protein
MLKIQDTKFKTQNLNPNRKPKVFKKDSQRIKKRPTDKNFEWHIIDEKNSE